MPTRRISLSPAHSSASIARVSEKLDALVAKSGLTADFPRNVTADAETASTMWPEGASEHADLTDIEFVTLDPPGSKDLDQALHIERVEDGYRVRYAIADVPLFVRPNSPLDAESQKRGLTVYLPDRRLPLHPPILSEGAASLLPGHVAPAFVWDFALNERADVTEVTLTRALVKNREQLDYESAQAALAAGQGHPQMQLLLEVGEKREQREAERGGASLGSPEQEVKVEGDRMRLVWRAQHPIEKANAQISLMAGMAAAQIMIDGGVGILRTMPPAEADAVEIFRAQAAALREPWSHDMSYGDFLRTLDWSKGRHLALLNQATKLFRGAGYEAFSGGNLPENTMQSALAAPYAHTTAPLRRLVDRFSLEICCALTSGTEIDPAILEILPQVPSFMGAAQARNSELEKVAKAIVETEVLAGLEGATFTGTIVGMREARPGNDGRHASPARINVQFAEPPIAQWIDLPPDGAKGLSIGAKVDAVLEQVDEKKHRAVFTQVSPARQQHP